MMLPMGIQAPPAVPAGWYDKKKSKSSPNAVANDHSDMVRKTQMGDTQ